MAKYLEELVDVTTAVQEEAAVEWFKKGLIALQQWEWWQPRTASCAVSAATSRPVTRSRQTKLDRWVAVLERQQEALATALKTG